MSAARNAPSGSRTLVKKTDIRALHKAFAKDRARPVELAFMLQDWDDPYNVGGMFRVADGVGASEMVLTGRTPTPPHPQVHVTSMGHHRRIPWMHFATHEEGARRLVERGYTLVAVEIASEAVVYTDFAWPDRVALVLGNEVNGTYASVLKHCAASVYIPMLGKGPSLNVHVSAAVVAYHIRVGIAGPG